MASSKREKELARQRAERQAARRAAAAARRRQRNAVIASVLAVVLVAGAAVAITLASRSDDQAAASPGPSGSASPEPSEADAPGSCLYTTTDEPAARPAPLPPTEDVEDEQAFTVTLTTSQGQIVIDLDSAKAPCAVNSFRSLAQANYFTDTPCHRLTTAGISVLQCGDPTGTGSGGPGYAFDDENLDEATYPRGTVAMANAGAGTNGSQFFLVYADTSLPPNYTPFGTITAGLDVLEKVAAAGSDESNGTGDGKPILPVQLQTVTVAPKA